MITVWFLVYFVAGMGKDGKDLEMTLAVYDTKAACVQKLKEATGPGLHCIEIDKLEGRPLKAYHLKDYT